MQDQLATALEPPLLQPLERPETLDPALLNSRLRDLQVLGTKRPLQPIEIREGCQLIRIIRGTQSTSGPKTPKAKKGKMSLADFEAAMDAMERS